jgi:hypothetical protein
MRKRDQDSAMPHDTLKEALAEVVLRSAITPKAQADELGEGVSTIYRWGDANQPDCYPPITKIVPHARATGNLALIRFFASRVNCVLVPLRELRDVTAEPTQIALFQQSLLDVMAELGQAAEVLRQDLRDGRLTEREARRCRKECDDVIEKAVLLREQLRAAEEQLR